jgi:hypothetical protein
MRLLVLLTIATFAIATPQADETELPINVRGNEVSVFDGAYSYNPIDNRTFEVGKIVVSTEPTEETYVSQPELKNCLKCK